MPSMLRREKRAATGIWAGLLAAALLIAGCGGSGSGGSGGGSGSGGGGSSPTATAPAPSGSGGGASFASAANCSQLKGLAVQFEHALAVNKASQANWQTVVSEFQALANAAPGGIRPDLQVIAHAFATYAADIAKLHLKPGTAPSITQLPKIYAALRTFAQPNVRAAGQHIRAWVRANCG